MKILLYICLTLYIISVFMNGYDAYNAEIHEVRISNIVSVSAWTCAALMALVAINQQNLIELITKNKI